MTQHDDLYEPDGPSRAPVPKVTAATAGAALATVCVIVVATLTGSNVPPGLEGALATVFAFIAGYLAPRALD